MKVRNILIYALSANVYYYISHGKNSQSTSNTLQLLNGGTKNVKQSKINTLIKEYELFNMEPGETVESMHMHFINLIKRLKNIHNNLSNQNCDKKSVNAYA